MSNSRDVYQAPRARVDNVGFDDVEPNEQSFYHLKGRIGRLRYLAYQMIILFIYFVIFGVFIAFAVLNFDPKSPTGSNMAGLFTIVAVLLYIPVAVYGIAYSVRRLHDLDKSGWLALLMIVPFVNFIFGLYLLFAKGSPDDNKYGAPPRANRWWHWVVGTAMPILFVGLAAVYLPAHLAYLGYVERAQQESRQ